MAGNAKTAEPENQASLDVFAGLEADDTGDIAKPFDPEDIDVVTRAMTIDLLLSRIRSKAINLQPDFQRRWGIWDARRQSRLVESLLLRIPIPSLYAAEEANEDWEIVDGVQRLYTIAHFIEPTLIDEQPLVLAHLKTLEKFNGRIYSSLPSKLQRRLRETEWLVHVIRHGTPSDVKYSIFERINTGSLILSAQELRHAITPGPARDILENWAASSAFSQATDYSVRPDRMADRELALRFIAFRLNPYSTYKVQDFDAFLLKSMSQLNSLSQTNVKLLAAEFKETLETALAIFGDNAFRKVYRRNEGRFPINKALFETVSVNLAMLSQQERQLLIKRKIEVQTGLMELCNKREFESAISQGTGDPARVRRRFEMISDMFRRITNQ
jgi:hypothetical protein